MLAPSSQAGRARHTGQILARIEQAGFAVVQSPADIGAEVARQLKSS